MAGGPPSSRTGADEVERAVSARIAPSPEFLDRVAQVRTALVARVETEARARGSPLVRALVAGSAARGTFLADRLDIDLFLLFPPDLPRARLEEEGLALGRAILSEPERRYAEHPYLRGAFEGFRVDAVPGYAVTDPSQPQSPVDRTPFHQAYLAERETPEIIGQVRLAKEFLRGLAIYGSEARTEGFSGYLVELLVLRFGSLRRLLEAARGWRLPVRLVEAGHEPPRLPAQVALILADPVDPHRNVASALSRRNLSLLILAAREYLEHPGEAWYAVRERPPVARERAIALTEARASHVSVVRLPRPDLVDDTLFPQVRKAERSLADAVAGSGFEVLSTASAVAPDRVLVALEVAHARRAGVRLHDGPPPGLDRVGNFLGKWSAADAPVLQGPYVRWDGQLAVETRQSDRELETVVRGLLPRLALGKDLTPSDPGAIEVFPLAGTPETPTLGELLRELLDKRLPWLPER
jgi:tRNA nucleotidyltransferase (CCA-adding enzyme)